MTSIAAFKANGNADHGDNMAVEIQGFATAAYAGHGTISRLDAAVTHSREIIFQASTTAQDIRDMLEEAAGDIGLKQGADRG